MAATVTVTGTAGAGVTVSAKVFTDVLQVLIDADRNLLTLFKSGETIAPISVSAASTVTATKTANTNTWTLTIS
ncbi:MAG: hypothetical protein ABWY25_10205 [Paenisporosarcina sp.]